jgi:hypothetical protein
MILAMFFVGAWGYRRLLPLEKQEPGGCARPLPGAPSGSGCQAGAAAGIGFGSLALAAGLGRLMAGQSGLAGQPGMPV